MGGPTVTSRISVASSDPAKVIPGSNLVIWCGPVVSTPDVLRKLAPTIQACNPKPVVGILFAQGCVHLLAKKELGVDTPFFALQNIPWLCRTVDPGRKARLVALAFDMQRRESSFVSFLWQASTCRLRSRCWIRAHHAFVPSSPHIPQMHAASSATRCTPPLPPTAWISTTLFAFSSLASVA